MTVSNLLSLLGVIVAVFAIAASYHRARRSTRQPDFHLTRRESSEGWTVTAHNTGPAAARLAWFEVVSDPTGRITSLVGGEAERVAVEGRLIAVVRAERKVTGQALDLVWLDAHRSEHRQRVVLPNRGAEGSRNFRGRAA